MKYCAEKNEIFISCQELVALSRRGICAAVPQNEAEPTMRGAERGEAVSYRFEAGGHNFALTVNIDLVGDAVTIRTPIDTVGTAPKKETVKQARGEGFITGFVFAEQNGLDKCKLCYIYENVISGEKSTEEETVSIKKLKSFFEKCKMSIIVYAKPEIERVTLRLPSMKKLKFPFGKMRDGQSEIIHAVYKNVARGGRLFTAAPTGTGKTVSMLFPAVRALGDGRCEKIFYFTPKTTTAQAAKECILKFTEAGANIRAVVMPSKERGCINHLVCKTSRASCQYTKYNKLPDAVLALYNTGCPVIDLEALWRVGREYAVCPHELALSYAELCDVVICDLNYLFDPNVYIRRFFTVKGDYAFLIDEAHNLPDRARELYSAEISEEFIVSPALSELFGEAAVIKEVTRVGAKRFHDALAPYVKEEIYKDEDGNPVGAVHLSDVPCELFSIFEEILSETEAEIFASYAAIDDEAEARTMALREYFYTVKKFYDALIEFDSSYEFFIFVKGDIFFAKCFCIDPAKRLARRLELGTSATFFSGTLSPMYYYRAVLGGDSGSTMLEVDSPFDPSQLCVCIMDKISTRISERDDTLGAVCRAIAATLSAKRGNYMIFSPSFAYSAQLARAFRAKYPKIRVLEQTRDMTREEKEKFIAEFEKESDSYLVGFCVMGGIYSEGIDLAGDKLIGAVVVGIGMPSLSYEREAIAAYYDEKYEEGKQFAYVYPGINRVLQAAGRVIRREDDRGVVVLIDDRFDDPIYKTVIPKLWSEMKFIADPHALRSELDEFWKSNTP